MIESLIRSFFKRGRVFVRLPGGRAVGTNGAGEADAPLVFAIRDAATEFRLLRNPLLAFGEAYMDGGISIERGDVFELLVQVTRNLKDAPFRRPGFLRRRPRNARKAARRNVAHHYDLSLDLYRRFLDEDLQYSCAYFPERGMSLEAAQAAKKRHIAAKLLLRPGDRVLDIGCGWGGLALTLAEEFGVEVEGITLSASQRALAAARAAERELEHRVRFALRDYRDVEGPFDRIVSVGMFEHVGAANYDTFFRAVARLLKEDGVALVHTIGRAGPPSAGQPWIEKYIFPGGHIPSLSEIAPAIERAGLFVADIEVLRLHYAETLKAWRTRFAAHRDEIRELYDERFCRMWEFYLAGSEASFRVGSNVVFQIQLARTVDAAPITRDYIAAAEAVRTLEGALAS